MIRAAQSVPLRRCRVCYESRPKSMLQRWVIQDGQLVADPGAKLGGRGVYACSTEHSDKLQKMKIKK